MSVTSGTPTRRSTIVGPESRGACVLSEPEFRAFLDRAVQKARENSSICGLMLLRPRKSNGESAQGAELMQVAQILSQLVRQPDAVGVLAEGSLAIALTTLARRGDAYVMVDRLEGFARAVELPWTLASGVAVFPLAVHETDALWEACRRDLEGAMSSDTWEHAIPRDTLMTRPAM